MSSTNQVDQGEEPPTKPLKINVKSNQIKVSFPEELDGMILEKATLKRSGPGSVVLKLITLGLPEDADPEQPVEMVDQDLVLHTFEDNETEYEISGIATEDQDPKLVVEGPGMVTVEGIFVPGALVLGDDEIDDIEYEEASDDE